MYALQVQYEAAHSGYGVIRGRSPADSAATPRCR